MHEKKATEATTEEVVAWLARRAKSEPAGTTFRRYVEVVGLNAALGNAMEVACDALWTVDTLRKWPRDASASLGLDARARKGLWQIARLAIWLATNPTKEEE